MSHNALVVQVMVSSPSDLPKEHMGIIHSAMRTWNVEHGKIYGIHFNPTDWSEGASPGFGSYAQQVLNDQIVDESDMAIVIFTDRMGTPTPDYPSGTAEEIARFIEAGKEVGVFRNNTQRAPSTGTSAAKQKADLEAYIETIHETAFVDGYATTDDLRAKTGRLLTRLASKMRREAEAGLIVDAPRSTPPAVGEQAQEEPDSDDTSKGVWPRVEVESYSETDSKGRLRAKRRWYLVLESNLDAPVKDVTFDYEDAEGNPLMSFDITNRQREASSKIDVLPPHGKAQFKIFQAYSSPGAAMCVVKWHDQKGKAHETRASVRTQV